MTAFSFGCVAGVIVGAASAGSAEKVGYGYKWTVGYGLVGLAAAVAAAVVAGGITWGVVKAFKAGTPLPVATQPAAATDAGGGGGGGEEEGSEREGAAYARPVLYTTQELLEKLQLPYYDTAETTISSLAPIKELLELLRHNMKDPREWVTHYKEAAARERTAGNGELETHAMEMAEIIYNRDVKALEEHETYVGMEARTAVAIGYDEQAMARLAERLKSSIFLFHEPL